MLSLKFLVMSPEVSRNRIYFSYLAACYYTDSLPCGVHCAAPCPTPKIEQAQVIDERCVSHPTGLSPRTPITDSCTGFSYCQDGKFHYGTCPAGQYFDQTIGKFIRTLRDNGKPMCTQIFKIIQIALFVENYNLYINYVNNIAI